jgi:hypothetical protein
MYVFLKSPLWIIILFVFYTTFVLYHYIYAVQNFYVGSVREEDYKVVFCLKVGVSDMNSSAVIIFFLFPVTFKTLSSQFS